MIVSVESEVCTGTPSGATPWRATVSEERKCEAGDVDVQFRVGYAYAVIGDADSALEQLRRARDRGYYIETELRDDPDLDSVRGLDEFDELVG